MVWARLKLARVASYARWQLGIKGPCGMSVYTVIIPFPQVSTGSYSLYFLYNVCPSVTYFKTPA